MKIALGPTRSPPREKRDASKSTMLKKPSVSEVHAVLATHNALIVHFSGAPKGAGVERGFLYPDDLQNVVEGNAMGGLSCSVVKPDDVFWGFERNATGCIGVVLDLTAPESLVAVSANDCGSIEQPDGTRVVEQELDITAPDVEISIRDRPAGKYNEWVVRDFKIVGVLAVSPFEISGRGGISIPADVPSNLIDVESELGILTTNLEEAARTFAPLPIFSFVNGCLCRVTHHPDLYPSK